MGASPEQTQGPRRAMGGEIPRSGSITSGCCHQICHEIVLCTTAMLSGVWALVERPRLAGSVRRLHSSRVAQLATPAPASPSKPKWTPNSVRTGVIARKRGMTSLWTDQGARIPVTVLQLEQCQVTANIKTMRRDHTEYHAVQVAATDRPAKTLSKSMIGHFRKAQVPPKRIVREFPVSPDAHIPVGKLRCAVGILRTLNNRFKALSSLPFILCRASLWTWWPRGGIGKGFAGGMKRWNFGGLAASHGVSVSHRSSGSTGQHQDPGRVFPGKKMPGRLGGKRITTQNLAVVRIDTSLDLVFVRGAVPGADDAYVLMSDAKKKMLAPAAHNQAKGLFEKVLPTGVDDLPFPAGTAKLAKTLPTIVESPAYRRSPFIPQE
ncbi:unnamed protein product [Mycena citricolor]|uniref:Large ribosomal subunit protein uL3m n=1 Tax=Mycena citricolor TaxID=2018698 RepID=A0AAD2GYP6_9AGAR|nr:unnamed protein product [Mycena citricolor]